MNIVYFKKITAYFCAVFIFLFGHVLIVYGKEEDGIYNRKQEIIFLVDCSQSMKAADPDIKIAEFIRETAVVMPEYFQVGVVTYATELQTVIPLDSDNAKLDSIRLLQSQMNYKGYSNVGAGFKQALELFSDDIETDRRIIFIGDGELAMPDKAEEEQSLTLLEESLNQIKSEGIWLDILSIGEEIPEEESILPLLEELTTRQYHLNHAGELAGLAKEYLFQMADITPISVGKMISQEANLQVTLPDTYMKRATIYLFGKQPDISVNVGSKAKEIEIEYGPDYAVIILEQPASQDIDLSVKTSGDMDVDVYLGAEYQVQLETEYRYDAEQKKAEIYLSIQTPEGNSLMKGHLKADYKIPVFINQEEMTGKVINNQLYIEFPMSLSKYPAGEQAELHIQMQLPETFGIYYGNIAGEIFIDVPPVEETPPPDWFLIGVIATLIVGLLIVFILAKRKKKYNPPIQRGDRSISFPIIKETSVEPEEQSKYDFCGKINIYVLQSKNGIDYPPSSINLFASCHRPAITLEWILNTCKLPLDVKDGDKIIFKPGEGRSLLVKNNGKATAIKGREALIRSRQYQLYFHEKITFIFEDTDSFGNHITELEIHYKELKANER